MQSNSRTIWLQALWLYVITLAAQFSNIAYQLSTGGGELLPVLFPSFMFLSLLTIPAILVGVHFGHAFGLGLVNQTLENKQRIYRGLRFAVATGVILGTALLILRGVLSSQLPADLPEYGFRGPVGGLLVSIGAGIGEEVWFRFGLMTLILFLVQKLIGSNELNDRIAFMVILLVGIGFGLAHLPQLTSYGAGSQFAIWATMLGNMCVSTLYGWCYWRFGLIFAVVAHTSLDLVLHCFPAFF
ncbi:CPBP family glutamic-type intramembrane protease [Alteromonas lipolytica]|uniref:CAAX prenyl protease 2/Lysostaphin resistance protein A-like domain-containing protein n=1 Tax=Alteromonas lipolytica TaxID=1856405 RepID=A0A1E8FH29_9ALTE|nr:CPBP family glutamic-type intramembrane protease [Alteromonas lipolytica]OFI35240.1 hypothetical protein BFC17_17015 [Alteromonas lipolytica]GGF57874.1 hypothetical protein GCM10011338_07700 [Alteromonas lipolytica]